MMNLVLKVSERKESTEHSRNEQATTLYIINWIAASAFPFISLEIVENSGNDRKYM